MRPDSQEQGRFVVQMSGSIVESGMTIIPMLNPMPLADQYWVIPGLVWGPAAALGFVLGCRASVRGLAVLCAMVIGYAAAYLGALAFMMLFQEFWTETIDTILARLALGPLLFGVPAGVMAGLGTNLGWKPPSALVSLPLDPHIEDGARARFSPGGQDQKPNAIRAAATTNQEMTRAN